MGSDTARLLYSIPDTSEQLGGVSRGTVYNLIAAGELTRVNVGRRGFITAESIAAYVRRITEKSGGAPQCETA